jgi:hypothetical protein
MTPAVAYQRKDKSVFLSFGNPVNGFHSQFDIYGPIEVAREIASAVNGFDDLVIALIEIRAKALVWVSSGLSADFICEEIVALADLALVKSHAPRTSVEQQFQADARR